MNNILNCLIINSKILKLNVFLALKFKRIEAVSMVIDFYFEIPHKYTSAIFYKPDFAKPRYTNQDTYLHTSTYYYNSASSAGYIRV